MGVFKRLGMSLRRTLRGVGDDEKEKKLMRLQQTVLVELYKKKVVENALNVGDKVPTLTSLTSHFSPHKILRGPRCLFDKLPKIKRRKERKKNIF